MKNLIYSLLSFVSIFVIISACSHEIKLTGDKDKPIPINAEIKIHIYQHAASVVDDLQEGLEEDYEDSTGLGAKIMYYVINQIGVSTAYAAESNWETAKENMKKVYQQSYKYIKAGYVGENRNGYVTAIFKTKCDDAAEKKKIEDAVKKLNEVRKEFYQLDAKQNKTTVENICAIYAKAYRDKAKGIWVEVEEKGSWIWKKID